MSEVVQNLIANEFQLFYAQNPGNFTIPELVFVGLSLLMSVRLL